MSNERLREIVLTLLPGGEDAVLRHESSDIARAAGPVRGDEKRCLDREAFDFAQVVIFADGDAADLLAGPSAGAGDGAGIFIELTHAFATVVEVEREIRTVRKGAEFRDRETLGGASRRDVPDRTAGEEIIREGLPGR